MRPGPEEPEPDLFDSFADTDEGPDDADGRRLPPARTLARSAGVTVALMVLACLGFIGGAWLAGRNTPDVTYTSVLWEGVVVLLWCGLWGILAGAGALALGFVGIAVPWVRRRRAGG